MRVAIAGGHGKIALLLTDRLAAAGDQVLSLIRNPDHAADVSARGGAPAVFDLERGAVDDLVQVIAHADAVVFAAGAGPGSGAERKWTMDRDGAVKLAEAAESAGISRYLMISSIGAEQPPDDDDVFSVYLRAKAQADEALRASALEWTIVRPGRLTDDPGSGRMRLDIDPFHGRVARADVAELLAVVIGEPRSIGRTLYANGGEEPIGAAVARVLSAS